MRPKRQLSVFINIPKLYSRFTLEFPIISLCGMGKL